RAIYLDHTPPPLAALSTLSLHDALPILKIDRLCGLSFGDITDALRLGQQFLFRAPRTVQRFHDALGVVVFKRNEVILTHPRQLSEPLLPNLLPAPLLCRLGQQRRELIPRQRQDVLHVVVPTQEEIVEFCRFPPSAERKKSGNFTSRNTASTAGRVSSNRSISSTSSRVLPRNCARKSRTSSSASGSRSTSSPRT